MSKAEWTIVWTGDFDGSRVRLSINSTSQRRFLALERLVADMAGQNTWRLEPFYGNDDLHKVCAIALREYADAVMRLSSAGKVPSEVKNG